MRRFYDDEGNQIVMCGDYAYVWPHYYTELEEGEHVFISTNPGRHSTTSVVTQLGSDLGGAVGFVTGRAGDTK